MIDPEDLSSFEEYWRRATQSQSDPTVLIEVSAPAYERLKAYYEFLRPDIPENVTLGAFVNLAIDAFADGFSEAIFDPDNLP